MKSIKRIFSYVRFHKSQAVVAAVLALAVATLSTVQIPALIPLVDMLFRGKTPAETVDWLIGMFPSVTKPFAEPLQEFVRTNVGDDVMKFVVIAIVVIISLSFTKALATFFQAYTVGKIQTGISRRIAAELYGHVLGLSMSFHRRTGSASLMARFTNDVEAVGRGVKTLFGKVLIQPLKLVGCLTLACIASWQLLLLNLALLPVVGTGIYLLGKKAKKAMRKGLHSRDGLVNIMQETFEGISIVKAFNMQSREKQRYGQENRRVRKQDLKLAKVEAAVSPLVEFLGITGICASLLVAAHWYGDDGSRAAFFYIAFIAMFDPLRKLSRVNNRIQMLRAAAERVFRFLDETTDVLEKPRARQLSTFSSEISFEKVYFTYNNIETVLRGVDLIARKGEIIALVGPSGAGKSTIARLIPRFYDPTSGSVSVDGVDLRDVTLKSLRDQIGLVTQEVILFNDTVASNIAYGRPDASLDDVSAAARAANADEFISALPDGYDSKVGEKGLQLSGGQRQRIALARAILKDPPILILDEATSSLDSESEYLIQKALDEFMQDRTSIVIAHRLSTVERASRIYVIDSGEIVSAGTNAELLSSSPLYKKLHSMQFHTAALDT